MTNSNHETNNNTNSKRVSIIKNSDGSYLIFNAAAGGRLSPHRATGLMEAMAAAYELIR